MSLFFKEMLKEEIEEIGKGIGMKKKKPQVVYARKKQIGTSNAYRDKRRSALPPGKRISKAGNIYFESRKNRSDLVGSKL